MSPEGYAAGVAMFGAVVSAVVSIRVAVLNRPKISAEANAANATGQTSMSADAREWAEDFREEAREARERANAAEVRSATAEERALAASKRASASEDRLDALEDLMIQVVRHVGVLNAQIVELGGHPTPPPANLIPPLSRP